MKKVSLLSLLLCCCWMLTAEITHSEIPASHTLQATPRIQAAYWMVKPVEQVASQFRLLKSHGLNTALIKDSRYHVQNRLLKGWGEFAERQSIRLFPVLNFAGKNEIKQLQGKFLPYVDQAGTEYPSTPCPLDTSYWDLSFGRRFEQIASLATTTGISGAILDTEMYGSEFRVYQDVCFCDTCWKQFIRGDVRNVPNLRKEERFPYLTGHDLLERYTNFQEQRLQAILSQIATRVHQIKPSFALGILAFQANWFYRGMIRGLGRTANPVRVFSETSYILGYTLYVNREKKFIREIRHTNPVEPLNDTSQPIAQYIPGVWLGRFFPDDLSSHLYALALHTDGYWIYSADSLWTDKKKKAPLTLHGSHTDYWTALKKANDELARFFSHSGRYQSSLPPVYLSSFYDISRKRLMIPSSLPDFMHNILLKVSRRLPNSEKFSEAGIENTKKMTYRGRTLFHCLNSQGGTIRITHVPLAQYPDQTHYTLFKNDGSVIREGSVDKHNRSVTLSLPASTSDVFSLLADSGANATRVSFSEFPCVVEASSTFPLRTIGTSWTYGVYVKPGAPRLKLRAYCSEREPAFLTVRSPENQIHQKVEIVGFTEMKIPLLPQNSKNKNDLWTIAITPVPSKMFEDVKIYLVNEEFPYLIRTQAFDGRPIP